MDIEQKEFSIAELFDDGPLNIPMASLEPFSSKRRNQCRFMAADDPRPLYLCCGRETAPGASYCPRHFALTRAAPRVGGR